MLKESLIDTAKTTAMVFIILFGAAAFTGVFMSLDGDQIIANWVLGMGIGKWGAFAIMCVIVFILGMFIDWLGIVMIVFPIFLPIMDQFGFDRLWLVAVTATLLQTFRLCSVLCQGHPAGGCQDPGSLQGRYSLYHHYLHRHRSVCSIPASGDLATQPAG